MTELKNEFSWSKTRDEVFNTWLRNFYASDIYDGLKFHPRNEWLEVEEFSTFHLDNIRVNLAIDCAIKEGKDIYIYDWKTGKSLSEALSIQLCGYALYAMERWHLSPDSLRVIEYNLAFDKSNWFSVTNEEVKAIKGYIRGSIKDMQSLLMDVGENIPMEEERFSKVEDERVSLRCNFRKVCRAKDL